MLKTSAISVVVEFTARQNVEYCEGVPIRKGKVDRFLAMIKEKVGNEKINISYLLPLKQYKVSRSGIPVEMSKHRLQHNKGV